MKDALGFFYALEFLDWILELVLNRSVQRHSRSNLALTVKTGGWVEGRFVRHKEHADIYDSIAKIVF